MLVPGDAHGANKLQSRRSHPRGRKIPSAPACSRFTLVITPVFWHSLTQQHTSFRPPRGRATPECLMEKKRVLFL